MANDLSDVEVEEVSLVKRPANKKKFFLAKKERVNMANLTTAILAMPEESKEEIAEVLKQELSKEAAQVLGDVKKLLEAVKDELSPELMDRLAESLGLQSERRREEEKEEKPEEEEAMKEADLFKSENPEVIALFKKHQELEALYKAELHEKKKAQYIAKAEKEFPSIPGSKSDELGLLLSEVNDLSPKHAEKLEGVFKSMHAFSKESSAFKELGTVAASNGAESAEHQLESLTKARIAKTGEGYAEAYTEVLAERPDLYTEYLKGAVS